MDCNSIIYDAVKNINSENMTNEDFENAIIDVVIVEIQKYIEIVKPTNTVFIAFDGVAPFAKMNQQRTRRYKSQFMNGKNISKENENNTSLSWNTSAITPGTAFMENLSKRIEYSFIHTEKKYNVKSMIVSGPNEIGEGEHKLMDFIRCGKLANETIAIYGLDADLIMLSIFQKKYCQNIYVFREAPEFIKSSIPVEIQNGIYNLYFLDIELLSQSILKEMQCEDNDLLRIYDYVFLCFLLGNDFLPHFPAMNIRTHGIQALMDIYRLYIGNHNGRFFISNKNKIQWKNVGIFINEIAKREHEFLVNEYFVRDKFDKRNWSDASEEELMTNTPVIFRAEEKYICPNEPGWETRYYKTLFHNNFSKDGGENKDNIKNISINYIEGLEWVFKYYTSNCPSWKWKYNYHYPPLFKDLCKYIPHFEMDFITTPSNNNAFSANLQLSYVLPLNKLDLLPKNIFKFLKSSYPELYPENYDFHWAFCRYLWEAHPLLPEIPIELLEVWDIQFRLSQ
jgi:5'-3' exonuclease